MKLTRIHQLEPTTVCNLACAYCPHPGMQRDKHHMSMDTFSRTLRHIDYYLARGNQTELSLTGVGEGLLHPNITDMAHMLRRRYPEMRLYLSTNGIALTDELCREFNKARLGLFVSLHRPEIAAKAVEMAKRHGILCATNDSFATSALDWAGTVEWYASHRAQECQYLAQGWGVVLADGSINTCCWDAEGVGIIGHIDDEPGTHEVKPHKLCAPCSLDVPKTYEKERRDAVA